MSRILSLNGAPANAPPQILVAGAPLPPGVMPTQGPNIDLAVGTTDTPMGKVGCLIFLVNGQQFVKPMPPGALQSFGAACIVTESDVERAKAAAEAARQSAIDIRLPDQGDQPV